MKGARSLILKIERTPKYWRRAFWRDPACICEVPSPAPAHCFKCGLPIREDTRSGILQEQSDLNEFRNAALLTIEIYKDSSPGFINTPVDVVSTSSKTLSYFD